MIPELGFFFLTFGFCINFIHIFFTFIIYLKKNFLQNLIIYNFSIQKFLCKLTFLDFITIFLCSLCLFFSLYTDDFSINYVVNNSNSSLPVKYKLSAFWAGHEGSLLLFLFCLCFWKFLFSRSTLLLNNVYTKTFVSTLAILSILILFFYLIILIIYNPFSRILTNLPIDGIELNPLLQDIGLILHPPILYFGYSGFSILYAFAVACLLLKNIDKVFFILLKKYLILPWLFLSLGIVLGSWWAYYELGWGGWWFWDPVENISLMPWLISSILIHIYHFIKKNQYITTFILFLCILLFSLCLFGLFAVRSGLLISVHSFVNDSQKTFILFLLISCFITIPIFLLLFSKNTVIIEKSNNKKSLDYKFLFFNKKFFLFFSSLILFITFIIIFFGTYYPIVWKIFFNKTISINSSFFNKFFLFFIFPIIPIMSISTHNYTFFHYSQFEKKIILFNFFIIYPIFVYFLFLKNIFYLTILSIFFGIFFCYNIFIFLKYYYIKNNESISYFLNLLRSHSLMIFSHFGIIITTIGIFIVLTFSIEKNVLLKTNETMNLINFNITLEHIKEIEGKNFIGYQASFNISKKNVHLKKVLPEKRIFLNSGLVTTEVALYSNFFYDLYFAMGEPLDFDTWSFKIQYKPCIRWIWGGFIFSFIGFFLRKNNNIC